MLIFETPRLALRRLQPDDLDVLSALYRDPDVRRYFPENTSSVYVARKIGMELEAEKEDEKGKFLLYARHRCAGVAGDGVLRPPR